MCSAHRPTLRGSLKPCYVRIEAVAKKWTSMTSKKPSAFLLIIDPNFLEDLRYWTKTNPKTASKVLDLLEAIRREPFEGLGKPEPLKGFDAWSRRISQEHRLLYRVEGQRVHCLQCRYHY